MLKRFRSRHRPVVGMDITPSEINILQISQIENNWCIESFATEKLPPNTVIDNQFKNIDAIIHCIKKIISTTSLSGNQVVLAIPDSAIVNKLVQINANLSEERIEEAVYLEAAKQFNYPLHEVNLDYVIKGLSIKNKEKKDVLITACRAEQVNQRSEAMRCAGLSAQVIEPESNALERIIFLLTKSIKHHETKKTIAVLKIVLLKIQLYVIKENKIIFIHEESLGNNQWIATLALQQNLLNRKESLTGWNAHYQSSSITTIENLEIIIRQIKKTLQFFYSTHATESIEHLFLAGERELLMKLCQRLPDKVKINVSIANPFAEMLYSAPICSRQVIEKAPSLLVACGLALRGLQVQP